MLCAIKKNYKKYENVNYNQEKKKKSPENQAI